MKPSPITLETERLQLRQWCLDDREPFAAINADVEVMRHFPDTLNRAQSDALALRIETALADKGWGFWALESKHDRRFIGFVGLEIGDPALPFSPCVEIGWRLASDRWRRGYATEAAQAALRLGFEHLQLTEIVAFTAIGNQRSQAVMERLGMRPDPRLFEHPALPEHHRLRSHVLYRLLDVQWRVSAC